MAPITMEFPFPTPALVYQEERLLATSSRLESLRRNGGCKVLYSIKACSCPHVLEFLSSRVDGFSVSSLFEARLSSSILHGGGTVHLTCPAFPPRESGELAGHVDYISFNSLNQWTRFASARPDQPIHYGLRVNPRLSFVRDERYDPCRRYSKLGIPIEQLVEVARSDPRALTGISGIHVHTNCESRTTAPVLETTLRLVEELEPLLPRLRWINLGGGYQYDEIEDLSPLMKATNLLSGEMGLEVFLEPGEAFVANAGFLVSSVLDIIENDGKQIAILDTTVNHLPQVFEYQYRPAIVGSGPDAPYEYLIAGRSCLAGDLFGEYRFATPLEVGSLVTFSGVGSYALVKSQMFNGINLPTIYFMSASGELEKIREYDFSDFWSRSGGRHAPDRT